MAVAPRSTSRFNQSKPILTREGQPTFGIAKKFRFLNRKNLTTEQIINFVVDPDTAGRPDRLAGRIYGDENLHWIFIIFNNVDNPFNWPLNGQVIQYPSPGVVSTEL